ncbi:hypothetical protein M422DRAFT_270693 [Sphaerobolus stellatus SS14]|uniref:Uncharacterized protein n=1 Tax=Sphaerobolus stellatus (strain SS14) TaxID=990650 RepID=A0A0C9TFE5_SPHS4|nr:hypothetical protein M422DRAFT_270693 [Sphaerobolus stellatus SS14]
MLGSHLAARVNFPDALPLIPFLSPPTAQVPKQDNDFDCGPFMIHNVGRLIRSFRNIVSFLKDPLSIPTLEASTIWEPMNIEEERLKSRERTKQVATRAREKALEEALKAAKKAERIRKKVAKSVQKVAGHYTTSSKPKQGGSTDQVFLYSRKTDLQIQLDAIWE